MKFIELLWRHFAYWVLASSALFILSSKRNRIPFSLPWVLKDGKIAHGKKIKLKRKWWLFSLVVAVLIILLYTTFFRFLPMMLPAGSEDSINLNTLRTFRVLRPLKLVSGVPSKSWHIFYAISFSLEQISHSVGMQWFSVISIFIWCQKIKTLRPW